MPNADLPSPTLHLSKAEARRFLLAQQCLWPPRSLVGKEGILNYVRRVGCIQYDPVNVVGQNPDLVLQARVSDYRTGLLDELLSVDRLLLNGWDKVSSICLASDWPYFARQRARMVAQHGDPANPPMTIAPQVKQAIRERGPLCSADLGHDGIIQWSWGRQSRLGQASLDVLYAMGELGVHHRIGTRRHFDLIERLLPADLLVQSDPNLTDEAYQDWHVARRVGGLGIANPAASECWQGILGMKTAVRRATLARLAEQGEVIPVAVEGVARCPLFVRAADQSLLGASEADGRADPIAAFIGPLDNLIWDRDLVRWLFDFDYTWEIYKPAAQREYGHYVLPVLYGDRFVARVEPILDRKARVLTIANWWWEADVRPNEAMAVTLAECLAAFGRYLGVEHVRLGEAVTGDGFLRQVVADHLILAVRLRDARSTSQSGASDRRG